MSGQDKSGQINLGQYRSSKEGHIRTSQVKTGCVRTNLVEAAVELVWETNFLGHTTNVSNLRVFIVLGNFSVQIFVYADS